MSVKEKTCPQFVITANDVSKLFPVDYSQGEFSAYTDRDKRTVNKYISKNDMFQMYLEGQFAACPNEGSSGKDAERMSNAVCSIPIEADSFFRAYLETAEMYRVKRVQDLRTDKKREAFMKDFYLHLQEESGELECSEYFKQVLYKDQSFQNFIMSKLWEDEIDRRIEVLKTRAKRMPEDQQVNLLAGCLIYLDQCVSWIQNVPESPQGSNEQQGNAETSLLNLLKGLIKHRKRTDTSAGVYARYLLENYEVNFSEYKDIRTIKAAFDAIDMPSHQDEKLLTLCRKAYLDHLSSIEGNCEFQDKYLKLKEYLDLFKKPIADEELEAYVTKLYKQYFLTVVATYRFDYIAVPSVEEKEEPGYLAQLIRTFIAQRLSVIYTNFNDIIRIIRHWHSAYYFYEKDQISRGYGGSLCRTDASIENVTYRDAELAFELLVTMWKFVFDGTEVCKVLVRDDKNGTLSDECIKKVSSILFCECCKADSFFNVQETPNQAVELYINSFYKFQKIFEHPEQCFPYTELFIIPILLHNMFLLVLKKIIEKEVPEFMKMVRQLRDM